MGFSVFGSRFSVKSCGGKSPETLDFVRVGQWHPGAIVDGNAALICGRAARLKVEAPRFPKPG